MLAVARRSVAYIVSIVLLCTGWGLLGMATFDYLASQFFDEITGSPQMQIWFGLLGMAITSYLTFFGRNQFVQEVLPSLATRLPGYNIANACCSALVFWVKRFYSILYQTADVIFCIGIPILLLTAMVGWWLIEEISGPMLLFYMGLIGVIAIAGIYNNPVRMLALGYFNGYWIIDDNKLSYPFEAPMRVDETIELMLAQLGGALWPMMLIVGLLFYFCYWLMTYRHSAAEDTEQSYIANFDRLFKQSLVTKLLVMAIFLLGSVAAFVLVSAMLDLINIHCFFAALAIFWMDALWRAEFDLEPALCGDCRYLLSGNWRP
ncbi:MAG: hypothetical protein P8N12_06275 [Porticoccaceae bacterium]|nr:hypothetical protein [Porticoccaceae bacterium]